MGRLLESAPLRWVGRLSYSLYLWQQLFFITRSREPGPLQHFPLNVLAVFACAALSHYLVEKPLMTWGQRLAGTSRKLIKAETRESLDSLRAGAA